MASPIPLEAGGIGETNLGSIPITLITGAQTVYAYSVVNRNAYPIYGWFYDKLAENINISTDSPAQSVTVPAATSNRQPGLSISDSVAWSFTTAVSCRFTTVNQSSDVSSPATSPQLDIQIDQPSGGGAPSGSAGGDLAGTYPNPTVGSGKIVDANVSASAAIAESKLALASDASAGTASRRTLGTTGIQACAGNDARLSDSRAPSGAASGNLTGSYPGPTIANAVVTDTMVATANKDGLVGTASMRTLGTGAQQACAGNDARLSDSRAPSGAASGDLSGSYPGPTVSSVGGVAFAASATTDATQAANISGIFPTTQVKPGGRTHLAEASTLNISNGNGIDYDTVATGTLSAITFANSLDVIRLLESRIRIVVSNGPFLINIPTSRRLGTTAGTVTSVTLNNGNHELSWATQPSGGGGSLELWLADTGDDIRQTFSNANVTINSGVRQVAQVGTMSAPATATLPLASTYPNGTGFWITDESGTVGNTNKITLACSGSDHINTTTSFDLTVASFNKFIQSDGSSKWTIDPNAAGGSGTVNGGTAGNFAKYATSGTAVSDGPAVPAGAVVGTTDTQTLTNKTLTTPNVATLNSGAGNNLALAGTAPAIITTAQAGVNTSLNASDAVAGSSVAGGANGGALTLTAGDAKRFTSGTGAGGIVSIQTGLGIGGGSTGAFKITLGGTQRYQFDTTGFTFQQDNANDLGAATTNRPRNGFFSGYVQAGVNVVAKTGNYSVLSSDQGILFTNTGAAGEVDFTLPTSSAGLRYEFYVDVAQTLKIIAGASTTIRVAGSISSSAGNASSATVGNFIRLVSISPTQWIALGREGTWTTA